MIVSERVSTTKYLDPETLATDSQVLTFNPSRTGCIATRVRDALNFLDVWSVHWQRFRPFYIELLSLKSKLSNLFNITDEQFDPVLTQATDMSTKVLKKTAVYHGVEIELMLGPKIGPNFIPLVGREEALILRGITLDKKNPPCTIFVRHAKTLRPRESNLPKGAYPVPPIRIVGVYDTSATLNQSGSEIEDYFLPNREQLITMTGFLKEFIESKQ